MKLDKRIKSSSDILTSFDFDIEKAKQFLDQKGYFADDLYCFVDLRSCSYGTLANILDDLYNTFQMEEDGIYHSYFIPERFLKPKEKKYRPYTLQEFKDIFTIGQPIKYRRKGNVGLENEIVLDGYSHEQRGDQIFTYIFIGVEEYTLQELFENYEWQKHYTEDFQPFGVEE